MYIMGVQQSIWLDPLVHVFGKIIRFKHIEISNFATQYNDRFDISLVLPKYEVKIEMDRPFQAVEYGDIHGTVQAK